MAKEPGEFHCPNCGSDAEANMRTTLSVPLVDKDHAWDPVFEMRHCDACGATIPAQLAERWGGIDEGEARRLWESIFRDTSPLKPFYWRAD